MTKKVLSCDYEFQQLAGAEDGVGMERAVLGFLSELLSFWLEQTHTAFENFLRIFKQKYARAKRVLGTLSSRETCIFYVGVLFATQRILEALYLAELQQSDLVSTFAKQSPRSEEILLCLYRRNNGSGMRHGELAEALGLSDSALTNAMKRVLQSGAVEASRYGKNTFYTLSKAGQRYCAERRKKSDTRTSVQDTYSLLLKHMVEINKSRGPVLRAGDRVQQVTIDGENQGEFLIREILQMAEMKSVNLEKVTESDSGGVNTLSQFYAVRSNELLDRLDLENAAAV